ncbi:hypothetical protein QP178_05315 [Sphingomonas aurantiaca]|uniref:hypothetical protein n=1 Tax=Sphingomonas aurantiaca TaxID=185949 RepID=UPI002FE1BB2E
MTDDDNKNATDAAPSSAALITQHRETTAKTILVNGREHRFAGEEIGRNELARLAFPASETAGRGALTVAYDRGPLDAPSGILSAERKTRVLDGQTFSVSRTDKS